MNPLTFFPPPSRSLSRQGAPPARLGSAGNGGPRSSHHHNLSLSSVTHPSDLKEAAAVAAAAVAEASKSGSATPTGSAISRPASATPPSGVSDGEAEAAKSTTAINTKQQPRKTSTTRSPTSARGGLARTISANSASASTLSMSVGSEGGSASPTNHIPGWGSLATSGGAGGAMAGALGVLQQERSVSSSSVASGGRMHSRLPSGMFWDTLRPEEISQAVKMEREGFGEDAASLEKLKYRQRMAPHLFLGAFLPTAAPKLAGPLSISANPPRQLIAYACATAASALTARSMSSHSTDDDAWLVCLHSVCVLPSQRGRGVGRRLVEEYMRRLRAAEESQPAPESAGADSKVAKATGSPRGYECVALLAHEEAKPFFEHCGFKQLGVSHVQWGSGGWFELRRWIVPKDEGKPKPAADEKAEDKAAEKTADKPAEPTKAEEEGAASPAVATVILSKPTEDGEEQEELVSSPTAYSVTSNSSKSASAAPSSPSRSRAATDSSATSVASPQQGLPPGLTQDRLLAALRQQSTSSSNSGPRNPGVAYSAVLGQALAAKTAVEDAFHALEARLVDRETDTNLAELYCPREECGCKIVGKGVGIWEIAETGPLSSPNLKLPNSPAPPQAPTPPPPPASALARVRSAVPSSFGSYGAPGSSSVGTTRTPVRAFWAFLSPMSFDNIGFSKDDSWVLPPLAHASPSNGTSPLSPVSEEEGGGGGKPTRKPTFGRKGSLFWNNGAEKKRQEKERNEAIAAATAAAAASAKAAEAGATEDAPSVKVKYLLCAECDCGPLGYTVLSAGMQDGGLANSVGQQLNAAGAPGEKPAQPEPPVFLIAADRVRYRFPKN